MNLPLPQQQPGRPAIEESRYHAQIEAWLNDGHHIDSITGTALQKAVGGNYRKTCEILEAYKAGYEQKEAQEMPELPDDVRAESMQYLNKIASLFRNADLAGKNEMAETHKQELAVRDSKIQEQASRIDELIDIETTLKQQLEGYAGLQDGHDLLLETHRKSTQELDQKRILVNQQALRIDEKDEQIGKLETEKGKLQDALNDAQNEIKDGLTKNEQLAEKMGKAEQVAEDAKGQLNTKAQAYDAVKRDLDHIKPEHDQLQQDYKTLDKQHRNSELALGKANTEIEGLKSQIQNLTDLLKSKQPKAGNKTGK